MLSAEISGEFARLGPRLPRALVRLVMQGAAHPRRTHEAAKDADILKKRIAETLPKRLMPKSAGLDGLAAEPPGRQWRHGIRAAVGTSGWGGRTFEEELETPRASPEMYVDEHALGILAGHLVGLTIDEVPEWLLSLAGHFMAWTIEANNGPPDDDEKSGRIARRWKHRRSRIPRHLVSSAPVRSGPRLVYRTDNASAR